MAGSVNGEGTVFKWPIVAKALLAAAPTVVAVLRDGKVDRAELRQLAGQAASALAQLLVSKPSA